MYICSKIIQNIKTKIFFITVLFMAFANSAQYQKVYGTSNRYLIAAIYGTANFNFPDLNDRTIKTLMDI
jgi:hypothetical protein